MKIKIIILIFFVFLLTGCWDYVGIDQITIITGIAVDKNEEDKKYNLTFEFASLNDSAKEKGMVTKYIESSGKTIFDAVRNAKKRVINKLYFANTQVLILSDAIAKDGIEDVIYFFLRDAEMRETIYLTIAKDDKAKDILMAKTVDNPSTAYEIRDIIKRDRDVVGTIKQMMLYETYDALKNSSESLALPMMHLTENDNKKIVESYGLGLFKKDKMIHTLNAADSKTYLFISGCINGGILSLKQDGEKYYDLSLEIAKNSTKQSYTYKNKKFKITIEINITAYLNEYQNQPHILTEKEINIIEKDGETMLEKEINKLISKAKKEYKRDVFNFGNLVYNSNPKLWSKVKKNWDKEFIKSDIEIKSKIKIVNTSYLR
jgi:spore germination protein KC